MVDGKNQVEAGEEEDLEKIMQEINSIEQEGVAMQHDKKTATVHALPPQGVKSAPTSTGSEEQSLRLELTGSIHMRLSFASGARSVDLYCTDDSLVCRLADGSEFRVPLHTNVSAKRSA